MNEYLIYVYLVNLVFLIAICVTELKKSNLNFFTIYGICLVSYPPSLLEIIELLGFKLPELTLIAILWLPVCLLGLNIVLSPGPMSIRPTVLLLMVPTFIAFLNGILLNQTTLYPLIFLVLTLPFLRTYAQSNASVDISNLVFISIIIRLIVHFLVVLLQRQPQLGSCRADKCNFFGTFITPFGLQSNFMSMTFALLAPLLLYFLSGKKLLIAALVLLVNVDLTGGRTGLFAAVIVSVTVLLMKSYKFGNSRIIHLLVLFMGLITSLFPVILSFPAQSFSGRGFVWQVAKLEAIQHPLLGAGPSFWVRLSETTSTSSYYAAHNLWLEIASSTGIIAVLCFFCGFMCLLYTSPQRNRNFLVPVILSFLICGTFEVPVLPYRLIQNPGLYFLLLYISGFRINLKDGHEVGNGKN